jgi:hypothetical protein
MKRQSANPVPIDPSHAGARSPPQLFALQATAELGKAIADALGQPLALHEEREFEDGEHKARPLDTVMGRDVYVVENLVWGFGCQGPFFLALRERQRSIVCSRRPKPAPIRS